MATKQKSKKKSGKQPPNKMAKNSKRKGASAKKAQKRTTATTKAPNKKAMQTKPSARETAARKKAATASKRPRGNREIIETVTFEPAGLGARSAGQSGDLQGLANRRGANSESVNELLEEGNSFEAGIVKGIEDAAEADEGEVRTREVPEDDVPAEYLDEQ